MSNLCGCTTLGSFVCSAGELVCDDPNDNDDEVCDGKDNDCDGKVDEDFPNTDGTGDARNLETIGDMRLSDPDEGVGGFAVLYNRLLTDVAAKVTGAETREETATALKQGADRDVAKGAAVDLDVEAANLMTQQQAYQANAQVIQVARQLFDTLINSL